MTEVSNVNQVKQHNVALIKKALKSIESGTKNDMAKITGLSVATCNTILNELVETNEILYAQNDAPCIGRPPKNFRFNETYSYICCIYFANEGEGARLRYAVTDLLGNFLTEGSESHGKITIDIISRKIEELRAQYDAIHTISLGVPGYYYNNQLCSSGRPILESCDIIQEFEKRFPCKVYVENDMNAMAYGIYYYRDDIVKKNENITLIAMMKKDSLGSGTIIDGKILHGETSFAGELLHLDYPEGSAKSVLSSGKEGIIAVASRLVITFSAIINPAVIVFTGDNISEEDLDIIRQNALRFIPQEHMPRLIYKSNFEKYYLQGLSAIAMD